MRRDQETDEPNQERTRCGLFIDSPTAPMSTLPFPLILKKVNIKTKGRVGTKEDNITCTYKITQARRYCFYGI